jgi:hypothetical protein
MHAQYVSLTYVLHCGEGPVRGSRAQRDLGSRCAPLSPQRFSPQPAGDVQSAYLVQVEMSRLRFTACPYAEGRMPGPFSALGLHARPAPPVRTKLRRGPSFSTTPTPSPLNDGQNENCNWETLNRLYLCQFYENMCFLLC